MWLKRKKAKEKRQAKAKAEAKSPAVRHLEHSDKAEAARVLRTLEDPELSMDLESTDGCDPYNSGVFDRSKIWESWERQD